MSEYEIGHDDDHCKCGTNFECDECGQTKRWCKHDSSTESTCIDCYHRALNADEEEALDMVARIASASRA